MALWFVLLLSNSYYIAITITLRSAALPDARIQRGSLRRDAIMNTATTNSSCEEEKMHHQLPSMTSSLSQSLEENTNKPPATPRRLSRQDCFREPGKTNMEREHKVPEQPTWGSVLAEATLAEKKGLRIIFGKRQIPLGEPIAWVCNGVSGVLDCDVGFQSYLRESRIVVGRCGH